MQKRQYAVNLPIEVLRSVVAVSETGSLSKAGDRLGLSQPAISSQIKRIQGLVGGSLFVRTANGTTVTELGKLALKQARLILEANDQLLRLGGGAPARQTLRIGLSTLLVDEFCQAVPRLDDIIIDSDSSTEIGKRLLEGTIDIACMYDNSKMDPEVSQMIVGERDEQVVWVRAKGFVLSHGAPIPILTHPGNDWIIPTLNKLGLPYKIVLSSKDYQARLSAVAAGIGLAAIPARKVPSHLVQAKEYYLPALPAIKVLLCARSGIASPEASDLMKQLAAIFFKPDREQAQREQA